MQDEGALEAFGDEGAAVFLEGLLGLDLDLWAGHGGVGDDVGALRGGVG